MTSIAQLAQKEGLCGCGTYAATSNAGSSSICNCITTPKVVSGGVTNIWNVGTSGWGGWGCCGGSWNGGLFTFSDIVKDRKKVSFWDSFSAGFKEQLYVNPLGSLGQGLGLLGVGCNLVGNISNNLANWSQGNK